MSVASIRTTVTELPASRVRVSARVAPDEFQRTIDRAARQLGRNLRVPGFRKGKAPPPMVIQRMGRTAVVDRAVHDGLKRWYGAALEDAGIAPVGEPKLDVGDAPADGEPLTFSIEIGVRPVATLGRYKGLEVGRREPEVEEEAVQAELQTLREQSAQTEAVQRPARHGDLLVIDFNGLIDGEPFDGGRGRNQMVELGSGMLVAGFEAQLEGASTGEERIVTIDFPNVDSPTDHRAEEVAGSQARFVVAVKDVLAKELPALDDAFALKSAGFDTLAELREDIVASVLASDADRVAEEFAETVLDAVAAEATVELPDELIRARAREIWERTLRTLDYQGVTKDVYLQIAGKTEQEALAELLPQAAAELRREAVTAAVAEAEAIVVGDAELRAGDSQAEPPEDGSPPENRSSRRERLVRRRVLDLLAGAAVGISLEEAQSRNMPQPCDRAPTEPGLPMPEEPELPEPRSGEG